MNRKTNRLDSFCKRMLWLSVLLLGGMLASCTTEVADDTSLPHNRYPLTFTTSVGGILATRATTDNTWMGDEGVAVQVGNDIKQYTPKNVSEGITTLSAAEGVTPFYWQSTTDINVAAWYYGTGYSATSPASASWTWSVKADQNGTSPNGYLQSDFLYAPSQSIAFITTNEISNNLLFYHQTAKVVINIKNAEAATDATKITSVVIGADKNLSLRGGYSIPTGTNTAGVWTPVTTTADMGSITARVLATPNKIGDGSEDALVSYTALVIPQNMTGKKFIAITLSDGDSSGGTYYYIPMENNDANLQSGKQHTYDITVKKTYLEVVVSDPTQWTGSEEDIDGNAQTVIPGTDGKDSDWTQNGEDDETNGNTQTVTPGTDGKDSDWTQNGSAEDANGNTQTVSPGTDGNDSSWTQDGSAEDTNGNTQTITPGMGGNDSSWTQNGSAEDVTGTVKNNP